MQMMMQFSPEPLIASISAIMQGIQTWIAYRDLKLTQAKIKEAYSKELDSDATKKETHTLLDIIPPEILGQLVKRVHACWSKYNNVISADQEYLPEEIDNATEAVKRCLCRELQRIYDLNGYIPEGILNKWWEQYCIN